MSRPDIFLLHGAWHSSACWTLLRPYLEALGHSVYAPDLPGHGNNNVELNSISLNKYSSYISQLIDINYNKVILVGHSMSGMVISQVAEKQPHKIERLIYLSAYLPRHQQSLFDLIASNSAAAKPAPIEKAMQLSADKRSCLIAPEKIAPLFYNRCPEDKRDQLPKSFPAQAVLPLSGKVSLSEANFGQLAKTYICCLDDQVIPIAHQRHMIRQQPCDEMIQLDADHSPFLCCPEQLASVLHSSALPA